MNIQSTSKVRRFSSEVVGARKTPLWVSNARVRLIMQDHAFRPQRTSGLKNGVWTRVYNYLWKRIRAIRSTNE